MNSQYNQIIDYLTQEIKNIYSTLTGENKLVPAYITTTGNQINLKENPLEDFIKMHGSKFGKKSKA
jgi:hypothetical protein